MVDDAPAKSLHYGGNGWKTLEVSELDGARASKTPDASGWRQDPLPDLSKHEAFMRITNLLDASRGQVLPVWRFKLQGIRGYQCGEYCKAFHGYPGFVYRTQRQNECKVRTMMQE